MINNFTSKIQTFLEAFLPIWNYRLITSPMISIKLGNIVLAILFFLVISAVVKTILSGWVFPLLGKKIEDEKATKLIENVFYLFFGIILLLFSLKILGFSAKIFSTLWGATLFSIQDNSINFGNFIIGLVLLVFGLKLSKYISTKINILFQNRMDFDLDTRTNIETLIKYVLIIIIVIFCLSIIGIPLTAFTIIGGSLAIGVGFGSKELINNFISGMLLMSEKQHKIGDIIQVENNSGIIEHIGARSTRIRTFDNMRITIPNSKLMENTITNWSLIDSIVRRKVVVGVAYGSPVREVEKLIMQATKEHTKIEEKPAPTVLFLEFADSCLTFETRFWTNFKKPIDMLQIESDLRFRIDELFREADIEIAFPQLDVHFDSNHPIEFKEI